MKRYEIPKYVAEEVKNAMGTSEVSISKMHSTNIKEVSELYEKIKALWDTMMAVRPYINQFPEGFKCYESYHVVGVRYDSHNNVALLLVPIYVDEHIPVDEFPIDEREDKIDVSKMGTHLWFVLLNKVLNELRAWKDYLEWEV